MNMDKKAYVVFETPQIKVGINSMDEKYPYQMYLSFKTKEGFREFSSGLGEVDSLDSSPLLDTIITAVDALERLAPAREEKTEAQVHNNQENYDEEDLPEEDCDDLDCADCPEQDCELRTTGYDRP